MKNNYVLIIIFCYSLNLFSQIPVRYNHTPNSKPNIGDHTYLNSEFASVEISLENEYSNFEKSAKGICIHGAMEIFAIVIEGASRFILGASILFPKTLSRLNSFKIGMHNGIKIVISIFPLTIVAGFLEGFITLIFSFYFSYK